jgi:hypothetical protein
LLKTPFIQLNQLALLAARPLAALQAPRLGGAVVISLRGAAITGIVRAVIASLAILIASTAAASLILLLLVSLFDSAISSITQIDTRSLSSL